MEFPFFSARVVHGKICVTGIERASFGSKIINSETDSGIFGEWKWDPRSHELHARIDPFGLFSLFYYCADDVCMLSPSPVKLIAEGANPGLDQRALAVFYMIGWFIENDTPFRHIKVLPPNGQLTWRPGNLAINGAEKVWPEKNISRPKAIEEYIDHFRSAVKVCCEAADGKIVQPLSGGRDSRHILLEMIRIGRTPDHCVTMDKSNSGLDPDAECAKQIARAVDVQQVILERPSSPFRDQFRVLLLTHLCSDESAHFLPLARYLEGQDCAALDGLGGDVLSRNRGFTNQELHDLLRAGNWQAAIDNVVAGMDRITGTTVHERIGPQPGITRCLAEARDFLAASLNKYEGAADPYTQFLFWTRTRREIALIPASILGNVKFVYCPYLDPGLVEFAASLPFDATKDGKFHDAVIEREFPEYSNVPFHDALDANWGRPSIGRKLRELIEGVGAAAAIGTGALMVEPFNQVRMLVDRKHKSLNPFRSHRKSLAALGSPASTKRYMRAFK